MAATPALTFDSDFGHWDTSHDRLGFAFCLALALHAALILGISFNREDRTAAAPRLEITLAQHSSESEPEQADFLAQSNQQGSGSLEEKALLTTRELADFHDTTVREVAPPQQLQSSQRQHSESTLLTSLHSSDKTAVSNRESDPTRQQQLLSDDITSLQRSMEIASLEAKLDIQQQAYAKRPRIRRLTSLSTKKSDDALYLHNWRTKVETIGNQHYPEQAKQQQLYGNLRLMVSLLPNGDVYRVKILESSGHKILDQAAIRIVHQAAPYDPFPAKMRGEVDVLEIIRTWRFQKNRLSSES